MSANVSKGICERRAQEGKPSFFVEVRCWCGRLEYIFSSVIMHALYERALQAKNATPEGNCFCKHVLPPPKP